MSNRNKNLQNSSSEKGKVKLKKGDKVIVIAGKDKGTQGEITKVFPREDKVVVSGINIVVKHVRPNPQLGIDGGRVKKESPIHISNVAILNPETSKADKISYLISDGKKIRAYRSTKAPIDQ